MLFPPWLAARGGFSLALAVLGCAMWTAPACAQDDPTLEGEARALFVAGAAAYDGGRYEEARGHFQRSYELSGRPGLLYNIGSAAERAREDELALRSYEEFLERVPGTHLRPRVETRMAALRRALGRSQPEAVSEPDAAERSPAPSAATGGGADFAPWIVVAAGAVTAIVGAVLIGVSAGDRAAVEDPPAGAIWTDGADEAYERGPALLTSGSVLLPVGVLLAATGVVWAIAAPSGERVALRVGPGGIQIAGGF